MLFHKERMKHAKMNNEKLLENLNKVIMKIVQVTIRIYSYFINSLIDFVVDEPSRDENEDNDEHVSSQRPNNFIETSSVINRQVTIQGKHQAHSQLDDECKCIKLYIKCVVTRIRNEV